MGRGGASGSARCRAPAGMALSRRPRPRARTPWGIGTPESLSRPLALRVWSVQESREIAFRCSQTPPNYTQHTLFHVILHTRRTMRVDTKLDRLSSHAGATPDTDTCALSVRAGSLLKSHQTPRGPRSAPSCDTISPLYRLCSSLQDIRSGVLFAPRRRAITSERKEVARLAGLLLFCLHEFESARSCVRALRISTSSVCSPSPSRVFNQSIRSISGLHQNTPDGGQIISLGQNRCVPPCQRRQPSPPSS